MRHGRLQCKINGDIKFVITVCRPRVLISEVYSLLLLQLVQKRYREERKTQEQRKERHKEVRNRREGIVPRKGISSRESENDEEI